jgi:uncharacterized membrane protein YdjX (TVP38/TMEM64 family)
MGEPTGQAPEWRPSAKRLIPVLLLVAGLVLFIALDLDRYLGFESLRENREWLIDEVDRFGILAAVVFAGLYALVIAFSIPGGAVLTIIAGFLFGTVTGAACAVLCATLGAVVVFLAARTAFGDILRARAGPGLRRMEAGFRENALSYLLVLRLIPLFPFWLVNLVPAFLGVPLSVYVLGTFFGIIPGTLVYASVGNGLGEILEAGETPDLAIIFKPVVLVPILALAVLAMLPVIYKKVKARRTGQV